MTPLAELFPAGDYRFPLTLRRGEPQDFFAPADPTGKVLAERARWLAAEPEHYSGLTHEGGPLLAEFAELCEAWGVTKTDGLLDLGLALEPDFLLLSLDADGAFRLRGGVLCFPTSWALQEKIGHTLDFIHGPVPGLNAALGSPINQFLARLKPGVAFHRDNWGLAATDELNLHPTRRISPPAPPVDLARLWLRVEHQALLALPRSRGVVFGIRIALHRFDDVARDPATAAGLQRALASMPEELAAYKRIDVIRTELLTLNWG